MADPIVISATFRIRRDTAANWTAANPVLKLGEPGLETNTRKVKYGDGATAWNALAYATAPYTVAIDALAALTPAADRFPYFTSGTAAALGTITAFGRSLVDDADATAGRATLSAAKSGANSDITSLSGLTTPLSVAQGGTANNTTGTGATFVLSSNPNMANINLQQTFPTLNFKNAGGTRLGYFQHDGDNMNIVCDVGVMILGATVRSFADAVHNLGSAAQRWNTVYASTGTINTSDEREKADISPIPDEWLDAWGEVEWCRFRFRDGDRWHVGLVAQRVHAAFKRRGIDAFEIGLLCFDKWKAVRARKAKLNRAGEVLRPVREATPAGDRWGLRYDECQALEAAWQRREIARLRELVTATQSSDR